MNIQEMKKLWNDGYILLFRIDGEYRKFIAPTFESCDGTEVAIAPKHKEILYSVLADSSVEVGYKGKDNIEFIYTEHHNFIEDYNENWDYQLKPKGLTDLNNCYCEATEEHYKNLNCTHEDSCDGYEDHLSLGSQYLFINKHDKRINGFGGNYLKINKIENWKQIHLVNNQWEYKIDELQKEDDEIYDEIYEFIQKLDETLSITDGDKTYEFVKPDFEMEILKAVTKDGDTYLVGYIVLNMDGDDILYTCFWKTNGHCMMILPDMDCNMDTSADCQEDYNLIPKQIPWYEIEENFPAPMVDSESKKTSYLIIDRDDFKQNFQDMKDGEFSIIYFGDKLRYRRSTNEEIDQLKNRSK